MSTCSQNKPPRINKGLKKKRKRNTLKHVMAAYVPDTPAVGSHIDSTWSHLHLNQYDVLTCTVMSPIENTHLLIVSVRRFLSLLLCIDRNWQDTTTPQHLLFSLEILLFYVVSAGTKPASLLHLENIIFHYKGMLWNIWPYYNNPTSHCTLVYLTLSCFWFK